MWGTVGAWELLTLTVTVTVTQHQCLQTGSCWGAERDGLPVGFGLSLFFVDVTKINIPVTAPVTSDGFLLGGRARGVGFGLSFFFVDVTKINIPVTEFATVWVSKNFVTHPGYKFHGWHCFLVAEIRTFRYGNVVRPRALKQYSRSTNNQRRVPFQEKPGHSMMDC
jgi:hypothetical protein